MELGARIFKLIRVTESRECLGSDRYLNILHLQVVWIDVILALVLDYRLNLCYQLELDILYWSRISSHTLTLSLSLFLFHSLSLFHAQIEILDIAFGFPVTFWSYRSRLHSLKSSCICYICLYMQEKGGGGSIYVSICIGIIMFINSPLGFTSLLEYVSNLRICDSVPVPVSISIYFLRLLQFLRSSLHWHRHEGGS